MTLGNMVYRIEDCPDKKSAILPKLNGNYDFNNFYVCPSLKSLALATVDFYLDSGSVPDIQNAYICHYNFVGKFLDTQNKNIIQIENARLTKATLVKYATCYILMLGLYHVKLANQLFQKFTVRRQNALIRELDKLVLGAGKSIAEGVPISTKYTARGIPLENHLEGIWVIRTN